MTSIIWTITQILTLILNMNMKHWYKMHNNLNFVFKGYLPLSYIENHVTESLLTRIYIYSFAVAHHF